jgi:prepilin-type N-terminal cleavage/methylation domain-containing protein
MKIAKRQHNKALTLIEVMMVILIIAVGVIGAMGFRFYCVKDAKLADVQVNAARIGSMLLENWKGLGGHIDVAHITVFEDAVINSCPEYSVSKGSTGPAAPKDFTALATKYRIQDNANHDPTANNVYYYITLSYKMATSTIPMALNAVISWNEEYAISGATAHSLSITTYVD